MAHLPVTADDLADVLAHSDATLRTLTGADWSVPAERLEWTCWETVEHLADDCFFYGAELSRFSPPGWLDIQGHVRRPGGPDNVMNVDPATHDADHLLDVLASCGAILVAMVRTAHPDARAHHGFGYADAEASACMGIVECVAHTWDVATALGAEYAADPDACARVLSRIFPDVEQQTDGWTDMLWATGRLDLPDRPRRGEWRWHNS